MIIGIFIYSFIIVKFSKYFYNENNNININNNYYNKEILSLYSSKDFLFNKYEENIAIYYKIKSNKYCLVDNQLDYKISKHLLNMLKIKNNSNSKFKDKKFELLKNFNFYFCSMFNIEEFELPFN
jgi:hypothetical protein